MVVAVNKAGQDWLTIRKWLGEKMAEHLEAILMSNDEATAHQHRGRVLILRELVDWVEPEPLPETTDADYS